MPPSPIRIAFCITDLDPGGAERAMVELVTRLNKARFSPAVFCLGPRGALAEVLEAAHIPVTCFGAKGFRHVGIVVRLRRALKQFQPDLLQTWLFHANLLGRIAGRLAGVPIIVSGIRVAERRSRFRIWADRLTQSLVQAHVAVSKDVAEFSTKTGGLKSARMHIIYNGVDVNRFESAKPADLSLLNIPTESQILLFVGRLDPQKDPLFLLDAFAVVRSSLPELHLVYVGDGILKSKLMEAMQTRSLMNCVHVLGWRADVPELLKTADGLALCSRWEGMPNVVLEAFAAGTPVVAVPAEGVSELIVDGETGFIVSPRDAGALAAAIRTVFQNDSLRLRIAQNAQTLVREKFTWDEAAASYMTLYERLLKTQEGRR
jgi:glycosyltransferase involved in cell wall biosynthesis